MIALENMVYGVVVDADVILMDVRADRYHALVGAIEESGRPTAGETTGSGLVPEAAAALIDAGLMALGPGRGFTEISRPVAVLDLDESVVSRPRLRDCVDLAGAMVTAWWRLRRGLPCRSHHSARPPASEGTRCGARAAVDALRRARLFVPTPRRCLPAALIASVFLARRGVRAQIVFGVRSHPFEAHCWIEYDGIVLDDDLARVSAYHPIVVGQP